jgi:hypothetical protein
MANKPHRAFKVGTVIWALVLGAAVLFLGASIMLPSTKRARVDFNEMKAMREENERKAAEFEAAEAATQATSQPTTESSPSETE